MYGDGVAAEGVQDQHIEVLWVPFGELAFQGNARVAENHGHLCLAILDKGKIASLPLREIDDHGVDFIQTIYITGLSVDRHSSHADAEHSHALTMSIVRLVQDGKSRAALRH